MEDKGMRLGPFTRSAGLGRLEEGRSGLGEAYARGRNTAAGPLPAPTTTILSPYVRRRLVLEEELAAAAVESHGRRGAERFVQEVFWRSYFKGHLEGRPSIWLDYRRQVEDGRSKLETNGGLRTACTQAQEGRTGIDGFDDWARQLVEDGWLHNHVRMWFASIWIFTLRLPWALGADFFMRHLLDGNPASNTLSWRWVAGLHTQGKAYAARADNIARYTEGRYRPRGLNEEPRALEEAVDHPLQSLPPVQATPTGEVALLLHLDDLHPESLDLGEAQVVRVGGLVAHADRATGPVQAADREAMSDALGRAGAHFGCPAEPVAPDWAGDLSLVAAWAPVGPSAEALPPGTLRLRRRWDELAWPRSSKGYFKLRSAIPDLLDDAAIG